MISLVRIHTETDSPSPYRLNNFAAYLGETCEKSESANAQLVQLRTVSAADYLPVLLFTISAFLFIGFGKPEKKVFPLYKKYNIPAYLSLFLQHRRLII